MAKQFSEMSDSELNKAIGTFCDCISTEPVDQVANFVKLIDAATAEYNKRNPHS